MGLGDGFGFGFGRGRGLGYGRGFGEGKGGFSGYSCVKFVFFGFNVFFWLLGCAILGVGIWLQVSKGSFAALSPTFSFLSATALCIGAGILILVVGFFGCCGAIMESKCLLLTYFILIVVIFMVEVVGGVLAFIYSSEIEQVVGTELVTGIRDEYPADGTSGTDKEGLKTIWSTLQSQMKCCGVHNYTDWFNIKAWPDKAQVPVECCKINTTSCNEGTDPSKWFQKGCLGELKTRLKTYLYIFGIVGICVGVLQILGLVASMALFCCLRQDKYYDE